MSKKEEEIVKLFDKESDIKNLKEILKADIGKIPLGMTSFQINNFVLNEREFPTDLMKFQQAKMELHTRIQSFFDLHYQYREAKANIMLSEGEVEDLQNNYEDINPKIKDAKIELQDIEIEKNQYKLISIQHAATEKLREAMEFYKTYLIHKDFESITIERLEELEIEGWKIKSAYYRELSERYNIVPEGKLLYPHQEGGLDAIIEMRKQQLTQGRNDLKYAVMSQQSLEIDFKKLTEEDKS